MFIVPALTLCLVPLANPDWLPATAASVFDRPAHNQTRKVPVGSWAGEHIWLRVTEAGAAVQYDCARGTIDQPMALDSQGRFDLKGVHVSGHGGPEREGERPASHPARYLGSTDGRRMTLTVTLTDTKETFGPYTLEYGKKPSLSKCL